MPFNPLNQKQKQFAQSIEDLNKKDPMEALSDSLGEAGKNVSNIASDAKRAVLERLKSNNAPAMAPNRPQAEDLALKMQGQRAMEASKAADANNVINRTQQEIADLESMAQFGDPDAAQQLVSKKELLRKYLMNNR